MPFETQDSVQGNPHERTESVGLHALAQRRQHGLRHRISSTIHASIADRDSSVVGSEVARELEVGDVWRVWWRHECQDTTGNLGHIHAVIWHSAVTIDELGHVPCQLLSEVDMILCRVRDSNQFMGGVIFMDVMDPLQLMPVEAGFSFATG